MTSISEEKKRVAVESPIHHHQQWLETAQKTNRWYYTHQRGAIKVAAWRRDQVKRYVSSIERQNPLFSNTRGQFEFRRQKLGNSKKGTEAKMS